MSWLKRPILTACALSCAGHLLFVVVTPERHAPHRQQARELTFTLAVTAAPEPAQPSFEPAAAQPTALPAQLARSKTRLETKGTEPSVLAPTSEPTAAVAEPASEATVKPAVAREVAHAPAAGSIDLSPRAAAATLSREIEKQLAGGSCSVARDSDTGCDESKAPLPQAPAPRGLGARAPGNQEFALSPARGGGYVHTSPGFNARIEPNGDVRFDDKTRDLNDLVSHMIGEQAYTAQKRRFLAQTSELRDQLAAEALVKDQRRGIAALSHQLQRILADASRSALQKRIAIFALWDDCANDKLGAEAQHTIERFVREHMPEGGALAYAADELAELNRRRVSKRAFAPYSVGDAGTRPG